MNIFFCEDRGYFIQLPKITELLKIKKFKNKKHDRKCMLYVECG